MKIIIFMALCLALTGCVSKAPLPPSANGKLVPVNSAEVINEIANY